MQLILIVDDDPVQVDVVSFLLRRAGFEPVPAFDAEMAARLFEERQPDLVILDVRLGEADGLEVLQRFRRLRPKVPILMLTAVNAEEDRVHGLELGADDYLPKPFGQRELVARVRAMLRRGSLATSTAAQAGRLAVGYLVLDPSLHEVTLAGRRLDLTPTEFRLLQSLMAQPNTVVQARTLLKEVWGHEDMSAKNVLRVTASRLRAKLEADPAHPQVLETVRGEGLRLKTGATLHDEQESAPEGSDAAFGTDTSPDVEVAPIAMETIADLRTLYGDDGEDALRHLVELFQAAAPRRLSAMRETLEQRDAEVLARQGHTLKGSSSMVGAQRVARVSSDIEKAGRDGDLEVVAALLDRVENELAVFDQAVRTLLAEGSSKDTVQSQARG